MRISDWSSDVCSSDLIELGYEVESHQALLFPLRRLVGDLATYLSVRDGGVQRFVLRLEHEQTHTDVVVGLLAAEREPGVLFELTRSRLEQRSEEHTSELQSLMRISYAVFCLKQKKK